MYVREQCNGIICDETQNMRIQQYYDVQFYAFECFSLLENKELHCNLFLVFSAIVCSKKFALSYQAIGTAVRFDFDGHVIANDANIPISIGLHHHGEECTTPGYSLDELFTFARSNFLQQRVFALKLLARILEQVQCFIVYAL